MVPSVYEQQVFDGLMLSDLHLEMSGRAINARISLGTRSSSFARAVVSQLPSLPWAAVVESLRFDKRTQKSYSRAIARTRSFGWLTQQRMRWYGPGGKRVPTDLTITPTSLLWWYIGDGHLNRKKSRPNYRRVIFSTDSFSDDDRRFLIEQLRRLLGDDRVYQEGVKLAVGQNAMVRFSQIMPAISPVDDYQYKFEFGNYRDESYKEKSYEGRPLSYINQFRREHRVREINYISRDIIIAKRGSNEHP